MADMNITIENAGGCKRVIKAEVPAEIIKTKLADGFRDLNKQVQLPGFRRGKTPREVLEKRFGREIADDVRQTLADEALKSAVDKHALQLLGQAELIGTPEIESGKPSTFTLEVEVRPEFELPEYKGLEIERPAVKIADHEINAYLRDAQIRKGKLNAQAPETAAAKGHFLTADVHINVGEETIFHRHGGLLEVGVPFIAGLELPQGGSALVGLKAGDHKDIPVKLPADFMQEAYRSKDANITLDVSQVMAFEGPTLEEVSKEEGFENVEAFRKEATDAIRRDKDAEIDQIVEDKLAETVTQKAQVELPEKFSKSKAVELLQQQAYRLYQHGAGEEEVKKFLDTNKDAGLDRTKEQLKRAFVVDAIARKERLVVTEDELNRHVAELAAQVGRPLDEVYQTFKQRNMLPGIREELRTRKVLKLLRQKAKYKQA
ncbi:MAG: trigger factor [Planctomycetota bacterium]|nr:trigger factor [Planctomycetota bacterium]GIK53584.1 MAG: trigger factor [Planctomycetota bacterium]